MHAHTKLRRTLILNRQSAVSGLLLGAFALTLVGMPILPGVVKDTSIPFPCQDHACGCRTAEACWKSCCCMTQAQKLAWASRNRVATPKATAPTYTAQLCHSPAKSCCQSTGHCAVPKEQYAKPKARAKTAGIVLLDDYHRCRMGSSLWFMLSHALPPNLPVEVPAFNASSEWDTSVVSSLASISHRPPSPPPKLS